MTALGRQSAFEEALRRHLDSPSEATRYAAYELGRQALERPSGTLDALESVTRTLVSGTTALPDRERRAAIAAAVEFLAEFLAPSELVISGMRESLAQLQQAHDQLRVQAQALERANAELQVAKGAAEESARARTDFLANMSHEIRTPMNAIIGMTSLLADSELSADQRDWTGILRDSGEHLLSVINEILDFSKIDAGRLYLELHNFDVHQAVAGSLDLVAPQAEAKQLELLYVVEPDVPDAIVADESRLRQVLLNLLSNAVKFTHEGEVGVYLRAESSRRGHVMLHFEVKDSGIGIEPAVLERIFDPFTQAERSTSRVFGGTGLGLAICRRLVELMGGRIWASSSPGGGSTFAFTIEVPIGQAPAELDARLAKLEGRRVLIVDDNATNRLVVRRHATAWGCEIVEAESAAAALAAVAREPRFDAILIDFHMPEVDGLELAHALARDERVGDTPMVLLSSAARSRRDAVFAATINKPIRPIALRNLLIALLAPAPDAKPSPPDVPEFDPTLAERHPLRILVADDSIMNQRVAGAMLERMGYDPQLVADGQEALEIIRSRPLDLVLLDVHMPRLDGLAVARTVVATLPVDRRPRLVALTADATDEQRRECAAAGMDDYLTKPITVDGLIAALAATKPCTM